MNKKDLVVKIAAEAQLTRAQAARAVDALIDGIRTSLANGHRVTLSGFGTFGVSHRKARRVRNPQNGAAIHIGERRVPRFAAAAEWKIAIGGPVNNGGESA